MSQPFEVSNDGVTWMLLPPSRTPSSYQHIRPLVQPAPIPCIGATWKWNGSLYTIIGRHANGTGWDCGDDKWFRDASFAAGHLTYVSGPTGHEIKILDAATMMQGRRWGKFVARLCACGNPKLRGQHGTGVCDVYMSRESAPPVLRRTVREPKAGDRMRWTAKVERLHGKIRTVTGRVSDGFGTREDGNGQHMTFSMENVVNGEIGFVSDAPENLAEGTASVAVPVVGGDEPNRATPTPSPKPLREVIRLPLSASTYEAGTGIAALKLEPPRSGVSAAELRDLAMWPRRRR